MTTDHLPQTIDPWQLAAQHTSLQGELPLSAMPRLQALLHDPQNKATVGFTLQGGSAADGTRYLAGTLSAAVEMTCERCLEPVQLALQSAFRWGLARSEAELVQLAPDYEPLLANGPMPLAELIEDELLLTLPIVPKHADCEALLPGTEPVAGAAPYHPFAVLSSLLKDR